MGMLLETSEYQISHTPDQCNQLSKQSVAPNSLSCGVEKVMSIMKRNAIAAVGSLAALTLISACSASEVDAVENDVSQSVGTAQIWPTLNPPALDPEVELRVTEIMAKMTVEQKVGQVIQADSDSVTPEEVKQYRLGSILSGGNSAPGDEPYASAQDWLAAADEYFEASIDPEGVEIAVPLIWGIDAVHGHANLRAATIFPHNIGLGAARDPDLIEEIMEVTARELIISGHDWTFAPTLAVPRDDRWGRTYEGFSEDPVLVASYGDRIVYGLQGRPGTDSFFDKGSVISSAKHFLGDGGTTNGVDQGDTAITEEELFAIHAAGYVPAIEAGVQTIMASFNSWNGEKMHGSRYMLTDILKDRMGFSGFVIGDWNGHGHIPGCTNTDCPAALNAGVDMYMAPDSWKGIYETTLTAVKSNVIPEERLDDAVRRILRVKIQAGVFEKAKPSAREGASESTWLGSNEHRSVARRSVRQSLVLLKNNDDLLPLKTTGTVLVIGDGADNISKQSGGWTYSWQGGGYDNSEFPFAQSILEGIKEAVEGDGGRVIFDEAGAGDHTADVVIAVYGEDPYAEFQGDLDNLEFKPKGFDPALLGKYREAGIPVVSVFFSGRPLWVNPEINASDAFVAAWLPGTEGGGVADVLFQTKPEYDFTGTLSFSWPATATDFDNNVGSKNYSPLFPVGYGLSYAEASDNIDALSEASGVEDALITSQTEVFRKGGTVAPWKAFLIAQDEGVLFNGSTANVSGLAAKRTDHLAQEDAISLSFTGDEAKLAFLPDGGTADWSDAAEQNKAIGFAFKSDQRTSLLIEFGCRGEAGCDTSNSIQLEAGDWREEILALSCIQSETDLTSIDGGLMFSSAADVTFAIADIRLVSMAEQEGSCE